MVIVMLTPLAENGIKQCHQYWPDEGSDLYHIYEVNLLWNNDFVFQVLTLWGLRGYEGH